MCLLPTWTNQGVYPTSGIRLVHLESYGFVDVDIFRADADRFRSVGMSKKRLGEMDL